MFPAETSHMATLQPGDQLAGELAPMPCTAGDHGDLAREIL